MELFGRIGYIKPEEDFWGYALIRKQQYPLVHHIGKICIRQINIVLATNTSSGMETMETKVDKAMS